MRLPVVPPTAERVGRECSAPGRDPREMVARIPPCYGEATVEKIAANAVMAGCVPEMMRVLIPLVRASATSASTRTASRRLRISRRR